eukprot:4939181-Prymnesium_polylepis.2
MTIAPHAAPAGVRKKECWPGCFGAVGHGGGMARVRDLTRRAHSSQTSRAASGRAALREGRASALLAHEAGARLAVADRVLIDYLPRARRCSAQPLARVRLAASLRATQHEHQRPGAQVAAEERPTRSERLRRWRRLHIDGHLLRSPRGGAEGELWREEREYAAVLVADVLRKLPVGVALVVGPPRHVAHV